MRKVELFPIRDCEAGYGPAQEVKGIFSGFNNLFFNDTNLQI